MTKSRRFVYSSDDKYAPPPVRPPFAVVVAKSELSEDNPFVAKLRRRRHARRQTNPFIESKAGVDGKLSADK